MQRIGVFVCHCGSNIAATVDVKKVVELCNLKLKDLKDLAKKYGCNVNNQSKKVDLIIYILRAENRQDSMMFNYEKNI